MESSFSTDRVIMIYTAQESDGTYAVHDVVATGLARADAERFAKCEALARRLGWSRLLNIVLGVLPRCRKCLLVGDENFLAISVNTWMWLAQRVDDETIRLMDKVDLIKHVARREATR